jgi:nitrite reductase/ring-hydroxylating ferredoxin subunit
VDSGDSGEVRLFDSGALTVRGSVRFELGPIAGRFGPVQREGFAVRLDDGGVRAYLNICPHRGEPVDRGDGHLYTGGGAIECQAHGALFDPATGGCRNGPCFGRDLTPLAVTERDGAIWLTPEALPELDE